MTINSATRKAGPFLGDGITTVYPFTFKVFTKNDVQVTLTNANGAETALVLDSDYSVAVNADQTASPGGTITYPISGSPMAAGYKLTLTGALPNLQGTSLPDNGPWYPSVIEKSLDYSTILIQQLREAVDRSIKIGVSDAPLTPLPGPASRANQLVGFDALGNLVVLPITSSVGAGDRVVDTFVGGADYTAGVTTQLNLSRQPGAPGNLEIFFDGVFQGPDQWTVAGQVVTFSGAIPAGTAKVFAYIGTSLSMSTPPAGSVSDSQLVWLTFLRRQVDSIAALKSLASVRYQRAFVNSYYGLGDSGGGGEFWLDTSDTTTPDNGGTVIAPNDGGGRWKLVNVSAGVSFKQFGAKGDNSADDTTKCQSALDWGVSSGYPVLMDKGVFKLTASLNIAGAITLRGNGMSKSVLRQTSGSANGLNVVFSAMTQAAGVDLSDFGIEAGPGYITSGDTGTGSTGIGLRLRNLNTVANFKNIYVTNFDTGVSVERCWSNRLEDVRVLYFATSGFNINADLSGGDNRFLNCTASNNGFTGSNVASVGYRIVESGGEEFESCDVTSTNVGVGVYPTAGRQVFALFFNQCLADTTNANAWDIIAISPAAGQAVSIEMTGCWGAFSATGAGLHVEGNNVQSVRWIGGRLRENGGDGVNINSAGGVEIHNAEIASNSRGSPNVKAGVSIASNVGNVAVLGCHIGNFASSATDQGYGIFVGAGTAANVRLIHNDLAAYGGGTGATQVTGVTFNNSIITPNIT